MISVTPSTRLNHSQDSTNMLWSKFIKTKRSGKESRRRIIHTPTNDAQVVKPVQKDSVDNLIAWKLEPDEAAVLTTGGN